MRIPPFTGPAMVGVLIATSMVVVTIWRLFLALYAPMAAVARPQGFAGLHAPRTDIRVAGNPNDQVIDDAGCACLRRDLAPIELRVETDAAGYIGHAFLHTPHRTGGFRTDEENIGLADYLNPLSASLPGHVRDDSRRTYDHVRRYQACQATVARLERAMRIHAADAYQVGDWGGGRNCATWATDRLRDAGLPPPPGTCPNQLAAHLAPRESTSETAWAVHAGDRR